jgi:hypothetical protein
MLREGQMGWVYNNEYRKAEVRGKRNEVHGFARAKGEAKGGTWAL